MHRPQELVRLHRMGTGCRAAAALLGMSPNTERVYRQALVASSLWDGAVDALPPLDELRRAVEAQRPVACPPRQQCSSIEKYRGLIEPLVRKGAGPQAIHDRIRQEHAEFNGSVSAVKRLCRSIRRARGVRPEDVAIPLETEPGLAAPTARAARGTNFSDRRRLCDPRLDPDRRPDHSALAPLSQESSEHDGERCLSKEALAITFSVGKTPMLRSSAPLLRHHDPPRMQDDP